MQPDFDLVHADANAAEDLKWKIEESVDAGWQVYLSGEGVNMVLVEALQANHSNLHCLDQFQGLWRKDSKWFLEMKRLNGGVPVEFDGYMEVFLKGKRRVQVQL
jgi:hypothetical protein